VVDVDVPALVGDIISCSEPAKSAHRALPDARLELESRIRKELNKHNILRAVW
jgi:hypothetical protein